MPRVRSKGPDQVDQLFSYFNGRKVALPNDLWLLPELCHCRIWGYPEFKALVKAEGVMADPPRCTKCNKFQNRMLICGRCKQWFYWWFRHSRQGYHKAPFPGHHCWNCCERWYPPVVEPNATKRHGFVPPPTSVLPPGYDLYVRTRVGTGGGTA